jgi:hypothetical protein
MESMRDDFVRMLESVHYHPSDELRRFVVEELPRNTSHHGNYTQYYSAALRDLVAERDASVIAKHDYRFGD